MTHSVDLVPDFKWTDIPTHLLHAELNRRQQDKPTCGSKGNKGSYGVSIHVFALFLILGLSTAACSFPIVVKRVKAIPIPHKFLFISRHFGTGVLIATAFVHLLPTAFTSLTDPCLPDFWNKRYPAMPGLIAMTAVFVVVGIEMFFASRGAGHVHSSDYDSLQVGDRSGDSRPTRNRRSNSNGAFHNGNLRPNAHVQDVAMYDIGSSDNLMGGRSPSTVASPMTPRAPIHPQHISRNSIDDDDDSDLEIDPEELGPREIEDSKADSSLLAHPNNTRKQHRLEDADDSESLEKTEAQNQKLLLQCLLLEAGILFHSIFIGMALSVATGTSFVVLLIAISFHQTFEGFALGSRISAIRFPSGSLKPWLMALAYGTTTPVGQAIGLAIHSLYDPASQTGLLTVGFMNAISSGLLLFAGLVELLAEDFLSDESYVTLVGKRRLQACGSVVAGALLMALVGAWA